jgi:heme exporter protein A
MAGTLRGVPDRAEELIDLVGLTSAADAFAGKFSTGMRARLKLALAIQARPLVLLLDEPSAALDRKGEELVERVISEQLERGALIMATNDPKDLRYASHEIVLGN